MTPGLSYERAQCERNMRSEPSATCVRSWQRCFLSKARSSLRPFVLSGRRPSALLNQIIHSFDLIFLPHNRLGNWSLRAADMSAFPSAATGSPPPLLSPAAASVGSLLVTATYVGSLYISKSTRIPHAVRSTDADSSEGDERLRLGRDSPEVIRARLKAVGGATVACCVGVWAAVQLGFAGASSYGLKNVSSIVLGSSTFPLSTELRPPILFLVDSWHLPPLGRSGQRGRCSASRAS